MRYKLFAATALAAAATAVGAGPATAAQPTGPTVGAIMAYLAHTGYADEFARHIREIEIDQTMRITFTDLIVSAYGDFAAEYGLLPPDDPSFSWGVSN